jgi:HAD superfamily phosphoserine phosphatase-like hydrolase
MKIDVAFFDIDGTLHSGDTIWEILHKKIGTWETKGKLYLQQFLAKEISFEKFAILDALAWKGISEEVIIEAVNEINFYKEIDDLFFTLNKKGTDIYLVSNSISHIASVLQKKLPIKGYYTNELEIKNKITTGKIHLNLKYKEKGKVVKKILKDNNYKTSLAVGDGKNDFPMLQEVDYPIFLNNSLKVVEDCKEFFIANNWQEILGYLREVKVL